jgi:hypothetical protein
MKIAFITDNHFDQHSRFEETIRIHNWIAEDAARRGCTYTLLGGDLFERKSTAAERNAVAAWLLQMAEFSTVLGIYGNHDFQGTNGGDLDIFERLETKRRIEMCSRPGVVPAGLHLAIACLPWPRRANLLASLGGTSREEANQAGHHALQSILRGLGADLSCYDSSVAKVFLGHVQTRGCRTSTGQELVGCDFELGLEDLALVGADFYALGHIHLGPGNEWQVGSAPAIYGGSPRRCNFGESEEKSYTVIEFDGPELIGWERVPTPTAPMILIEAEWVEDHIGLPGDVVVPEGFGWHDLDQSEPGAWAQSAEIRFRYHVDADKREVARHAAREYADRLRDAGAVSIKVEEQVHQVTRARAPEVGQARTLQDKLGAFWRNRDTFPGVERAERIFSKLSELEANHAA